MKIGMTPAGADPNKQAEYLEQTLEPRLNEARNGQRLVFFVDAAHFVLAPFLGFLWSVTRLSECLNQTHSKHKSALDSLLTLRFQQSEKAQITGV